MKVWRGTWWTTGRTVPGAIANGSYTAVMALFLLGNGIYGAAGRPPATGLWGWAPLFFAAVRLVVIVSAVLTVPMLCRYPELIQEPGGDLLAAPVGRRWRLTAVAAVPLAVGFLLAEVATRSVWFEFLQLAPVFAALAAARTLGRRPVATR